MLSLHNESMQRNKISSDSQLAMPSLLVLQAVLYITIDPMFDRGYGWFAELLAVVAQTAALVYWIC